MAQLVFSPLQFNTISEELDINGDYRCFEVPNKVYVDSDILISEFCSTIFNFSTVRIGQYLEDNKILWILEQLKKIEMPKIIFSFCYYKGKKELYLDFPEKYTEIVKDKMIEINYNCIYSKFLKIVDNEKQTIDFTHSYD